MTPKEKWNSYFALNRMDKKWKLNIPGSDGRQKVAF